MDQVAPVRTPRRGRLVAVAWLALAAATADAAVRAKSVPRLAEEQVTAFDQVLRENAHFFGILVTFSFTAAVAEPAWGIHAKDLNINLITREVRDARGRQLVRARVAGVVRKNNNVELNVLDERGALVGRGFFGYDSGQLQFSTASGLPVIEGFFERGGYFLLKDLRLPEGKRYLADGFVNTCLDCGSLEYAWYDALDYLVGGGRIYPYWYSSDYSRLRVRWTFESGYLDDYRPAYGDAEYELANEVTGAINSSLFDSDRTAAGFFVNPYSLVPEPAGKAYIPRFKNDTGIAVTNPSTREIRVTYIARRFDGTVVAGRDVLNPVTYRFAPGQQVAAYPGEIFRGFDKNDSRPILGDGEVGWIEIRSDDGDLHALFLDGDVEGTALDGNVGAELGSNVLVFPHLNVRPGESTEIELLNLSFDDTAVDLELLDREGRVLRDEREFFVAGYGIRTFYLGGGSAFLRPSEPAQAVALRVRCNNSNSLLTDSCSKLVGLASYRDRFQSLATSYAAIQDTAGQGLVGAHFVSGRSGEGAWVTTVRLTKLTGGAASVYLDLYDRRGELLLTLPQVLVPGGQATFLLDPSTLPWGDRLVPGYVRVRSDNGNVAGDVSLTWSDGQESMFSDYPLSNFLSRVFQFNQVAQGALGGIEYWTGVALMNDLAKRVRVELEVFTADGVLDRSAAVTLEPYQQSAALISEILNDPAYTLLSGYIRVAASDPITAIVLYGDARNRFLASVPGIPR